MMATLGDIAAPLERFPVMVERWGFPAIKLLVPAFDQEDAINRVVGEADQGKYYNFMKAYAPPPGGDRQEDDDKNRHSDSRSLHLEAAKSPPISGELDAKIFRRTTP
jgi:hypothetical protein